MVLFETHAYKMEIANVSFIIEVANCRESLYILVEDPPVRYLPEMANRKYNQEVHRIHSRPSSRITIRIETPSCRKYPMVLQVKSIKSPLKRPLKIVQDDKKWIHAIRCQSMLFLQILDSLLRLKGCEKPYYFIIELFPLEAELQIGFQPP